MIRLDDSHVLIVNWCNRAYGWNIEVATNSNSNALIDVTVWVCYCYCVVVFIYPYTFIDHSVVWPQNCSCSSNLYICKQMLIFFPLLLEVELWVQSERDFMYCTTRQCIFSVFFVRPFENAYSVACIHCLVHKMHKMNPKKNKASEQHEMNSLNIDSHNLCILKARKWWVSITVSQIVFFPFS